METPDQHLKAMLEMSSINKSEHTPSPPLSTEEIKSTEQKKASKEDNEAAESGHKLINKVHKLEKDVLYWQDKVISNPNRFYSVLK